MLNRLVGSTWKGVMTADGWSADTMKQGYLSMTGHWIDVTDKGKWLLQSEVVGFMALLGAHCGNNLGCYCVGLCNRVGIMGQEQSKVCCIKVLFSVDCKLRTDTNLAPSLHS